MSKISSFFSKYFNMLTLLTLLLALLFGLFLWFFIYQSSIVTNRRLVQEHSLNVRNFLAMHKVVEGSYPIELDYAGLVEYAVKYEQSFSAMPDRWVFKYSSTVDDYEFRVYGPSGEYGVCSSESCDSTRLID